MPMRRRSVRRCCLGFVRRSIQRKLSGRFLQSNLSINSSNKSLRSDNSTRRYIRTTPHIERATRSSRSSLAYSLRSCLRAVLRHLAGVHQSAHRRDRRPAHAVQLEARSAAMHCSPPAVSSSVAACPALAVCNDSKFEISFALFHHSLLLTRRREDGMAMSTTFNA